MVVLVTPLERKSGQVVLSLALVDPVLQTIARVVGCSTDVVAISLWAGVQLEIDVLDDAFGGQISVPALLKDICVVLASRLDCTVYAASERVNEGGTVGVSILRHADGLVVAVSV
jgi:hypothetical protein